MKGVCWLVVLGTFFTGAVAEYALFKGNYTTPDAVKQREERLYCYGQFLGNGQYNGGVNFPTDTVTPFEDTVWTLFVQFPVLSYIDHVRKRSLFDVIARLIRNQTQNQGSTEFDTLDVMSFCMGPYDQYEVATYDEGVIVRVYFRDGDDAADFNARSLDQAFKAALQDQSNFQGTIYSPLRNYLGNRDLVAINLRASTIYQDRDELPGSNLLPEYIPEGSQTVEDDPTLNAIVRYSAPGNISRADVLSNASPAANNPRPINYYLEAGDYVFIVIGTILVAFLLLVILIGYVIHPFFLA